MASVDANKIPEIKKFMEDLWKMIKDFWEPEDTDEYWRAVVDRVDELVGKYGAALCGDMCMSYVSFLENKRDEGRK
ncbi:MAG: hypothetical protein LUD47_00275 [Clostridia bacterium]|nr:hypothetical protein [Clostridia bacterium]